MNNKEIKQLIKKEYTYPELDDPEFQKKIYKKREFYYHKVPENEERKTYKDIKEFRDKICGGKFSPYTHQSFLSNFINPNTPYKGLLIFHGVGTGKTGTAITIAENFKDMVIKYNTKIYVLVPGPLLKENFKDEIIKFTGEEYMKDIINQLGYVDEIEQNKAKKEALKEALQYYKIMTHRSFYKKVLGEKIKDTKEDDQKKFKYRLTDEGEIERDISVDKIDNLDNTLLIVDEAHNFTGNEHGDALKKIIKKSKNLRILLLTATPMKNLGDDIIELLNFLRPIDDQIRRDKVFTSNKNHLMEFKPGGKEYFQKMASGYISYYRGAHPLLFAKKTNIGEIPEGLIFTQCVRCKMTDFQQKTYDRVKINTDDTLERGSSSAANIVFPGLSKDKKGIEGYYGEDGINVVRSNLKTNKLDYLNKLNKMFFDNKIKNVDDIVYNSSNTDNITGLIYKRENIKLFSTKFSKTFENISELFEGKKGSKTVFIYSNLVKVGIEVFQEILLQNGYLEFEEDQNYDIQDNTIDYKTGLTYEEFKKKNFNREFKPATFIRITGKTDDIDDELPDAKKRILDTYFNNMENTEGKFLKIILGSRVMNEGVTLENTGEVHILDVYYNFGRVDQVIGRAIRYCKHYRVTNEKNPFPEVKVYKYVVRVTNSLSTEEDLYRKAELKYILIKQVERAMKEISVDCAINHNGNVFIEETKENKGCYQPNIGEKIKKNVKYCTSACDFMECDYRCFDKKLNLDYYDKNSKIYKRIKKDNLDYTTFNDSLAKNEIDSAKDKIKDLFKLKYVYTLNEILLEVKDSYEGEQKDLFEEFFVYQALNKLVPINENDFNNFRDTLYDKFNIPGYLIYRSKFYIFQPFEQNEDVPMFYRRTYQKDLINELSLYNYLKNNPEFLITEKIKEKTTENKKSYKYDFSSNKDYYDERDEFSIVGIIDKLSGTRKITIGEEGDVFKIRSKRSKILEKKRGTGIPSIKGAVCYSSKDKDQLKKIASKINMLDYSAKDTRIETCEKIKLKLLYLEKYSTGKDNITYMMIPFNHPIYPFPLNLEDRIKYVEKEFNRLEKTSLKFKYKKEKGGTFLNKRSSEYAKYNIQFEYPGKLKTETNDFLNKYNFDNKGKTYTATFE